LEYTVLHAGCVLVIADQRGLEAFFNRDVTQSRPS
jgi:hypothetical protein